MTQYTLNGITVTTPHTQPDKCTTITAISLWTAIHIFKFQCTPECNAMQCNAQMIY